MTILWIIHIHSMYLAMDIDTVFFLIHYFHVKKTLLVSQCLSVWLSVVRGKSFCSSLLAICSAYQSNRLAISVPAAG